MSLSEGDHEAGLSDVATGETAHVASRSASEPGSLLRPREPLVFRNPNPEAHAQLLELTQNPRNASCWTIFLRDSAGLANAVGDFTSRERALEILQLLFGELTPISDPITRWY